MSLKILHVATTPLGYDGVTNVILSYLDNIDIEQDILATRGVNPEMKKKIEKRSNLLFEIPYRNNHPLKYIKEMIKLNRREDYDIVHIHGNSGTMVVDLLAAKLSGVPSRIVHSHNTTTNYKYVHKLLKPLLSVLATEHLACSEEAGEWAFNNDFTVIKNGIKTDDFIFNQEQRSIYRKSLGLNNDFVIGHVGHMSYQKNQEFLLDIFQEILKKDPNSKLVLVGDGKNKDNLIEKSKIIGVHSKTLFVGRRDDVNNIMQAFDVFVLPSRYEGLGIVNIEAQASGLKCFVSDRVPKEAKISNNIEYLSLSESPKKWAEKIIDNIDYERLNMKEVVYDVGYDIKQSTEKLKKIYIKNNTGYEIK